MAYPEQNSSNSSALISFVILNNLFSCHYLIFYIYNRIFYQGATVVTLAKCAIADGN